MSLSRSCLIGVLGAMSARKTQNGCGTTCKRYSASAMGQSYSLVFVYDSPSSSR
jgi:hypothetical protein